MMRNVQIVRLNIKGKHERTTMHIQNRRNSSNFKACRPLQLLNGLISLKPAIVCFAYTCPLCVILENLSATEKQKANIPYY